MNGFILLFLIGAFFLGTSTSQTFSDGEEFYEISDFSKVPKIDEHFHYLSKDDGFIKFAISQNFRLISPVWDGEYSIYEQMEISGFIKNRYPENYTYFGAFSSEDFSNQNFSKNAISEIKNEILNHGSSGVKIWKNIGMSLKDKNGKYVLIDDPKFEPIFRFLAENRIPVIGHLADPKDSWLPMNKMIDPSNVKYFSAHPQYYMFQHPEIPTYEEQINARDNVLKKHPTLIFVGAHLASLEWDLDLLSEHLDKYPNLKVDLAARMFYIKYFARIDRNKVRNFFIKYQDRIIYGTDSEYHGTELEKYKLNMKRSWLNDWEFLATGSQLNNLRLPKSVIDKIYFKNAIHFFDKITID